MRIILKLSGPILLTVGISWAVAPLLQSESSIWSHVKALDQWESSIWLKKWFKGPPPFGFFSVWLQASTGVHHSYIFGKCEHINVISIFVWTECTSITTHIDWVHLNNDDKLYNFVLCLNWVHFYNDNTPWYVWT